MTNPQYEKADDTLTDYQSILESIVTYTNDEYGLDPDQLEVVCEIHRHPIRDELHATFEILIDDVIRTDDGLCNLATSLRQIATTIEQRLRYCLNVKRGV